MGSCIKSKIFPLILSSYDLRLKKHVSDNFIIKSRTVQPLHIIRYRFHAMISVSHHSSCKVGCTVSLPAEFDLLLPARPKHYAAGFGCQCFTSTGVAESNFGRSNIMENEEYTQTQIK